MRNFSLSLNILQLFYLEQRIILSLFLSFKSVNLPENQGIFQILAYPLLHHEAVKRGIEQNFALIV